VTFDEERLELDFDVLARAHRHCCAGAALCQWTDGSVSWVAYIAASDPAVLRGWDEPLDAWRDRTAA
jgi:hypothetical protein